MKPASFYEFISDEAADFPQALASNYNKSMSNPTPQTNRFQQLRWKLTLTYTGVTIGALLTVELILLGLVGIGIVLLINSGLLPAQLIEAANTDYAPILRFYLDQSPPDQEGIANWLGRVGPASSVTLPLSFEATDEMLVVGGNGELIAVKPPGLLGIELIGQPFDGSEIPGLAEPLQAALSGAEDHNDLFALVEAERKVLLAIPIWDETRAQVLGVLVAIGERPTLMSQFSNVLPILGISLLFFTIVAGLAGTVYGYLAARGPVQRLNQLSEASLAWSQGDFTVTVDDPSRDELGQLAHRLNEMSEQLQGLLEARRELAVVEERNRLARDLHDSVKQQAFAAAAQISAAHKLIKSDPDAAELHIQEAEHLTKDLRRELTNLIQQLRPVALESKGLAAALGDYAQDWSRQNGIKAAVHVQHQRSLPLEIEQTLFRIVQEALANVARHSGAQSVEINLVYAKDIVTCSIHDDGGGFDPDENRKGVGLRSMAERAAALGGKLTIKSHPSEGTSVSVAIPSNGSAGSDMEVVHE
jgi:NarL family two-component system sensor histidine kinase LiaS